ncbi:flagellar export protein FliJ [Massilia sp. W12]|uniref:flagellar export protein FliJ n=1 Tax=Massilia sp. W12 TaxID=3126507 RepID=UPI0030CD563F
MATNSQLQTLIELAQQKTDAAVKRLGQATAAVQQAQQKLEMLHSYRDDYVAKMQARGANGISGQAYTNYLAFMQKLDNAIEGQKDVIRLAERRLEAEKKAWQEEEKKRLSYETLHKRALQRAVQKENKRDQRAMDEFAARRAFDQR